jgi:hypothetical protein
VTLAGLAERAVVARVLVIAVLLASELFGNSARHSS